MAKKLIACLIAVIMVITAGTAVFAAKGETDVNVAVGKTVVSSNFGTGGYNEHVVGNTIDGNHGTMFIPTISRQQTELVTIDLGQRFPITQVIMSKWGGKTGGSYGSGDSVFEIYASNSWSGDNHDELTNPVKFTGDADFTKVDPSGNDDSEHIMNFIPGSVAKYRYVQLKYVRAQENPSVQPRITEIEVYAPAESVNQTIVPVSVGKPIYSEFNGTSWGTELYMINDGDTSTTYHAYGANDTSADMIIDLENKYPITKVTHTPGYLASGSIDGVYASNDPSFASYAVFDYDSGDGAWYIDDGEAALFGDEFKYIKIDWSVAPVTSSDSTPGLWSQAEITVYSTEEAAEKAVSSKTNIALGKTVTSKIYGHNDGLAALTDGDTTGNEFINYATASTQGEYYDIDLGNAYTITNIKTYHNSYHAASVGAVWVSNDPGFDRHETFTTLGYRTSHDADPVKFNSTPSALSEEMKGYRYVRIFEPDNGSGSNPWRIREIEIYVPTSETLCENRALGKNVTLIGNDGNEITSDYFGMSKGNFNDGNESTEGGLSNGAAIIELDYPQEIEWVEVIIRAYPGDDNKKGYKVYLSNEKSVNTANALQIGDTDESPVYSAGETLRYNSNSETKYKYILVKGYNSGECIAKEIKVMGDDVITGTTITNKLTGTKANGEILTLNTGYTGAAAIDKVLNLYIARYDNGVLTDIVKSGDLLFRGNIVDETLTYTITEDVTPQTQFKGFAWEKNSLAPFADNAEIATEYTEAEATRGE